MKITSISTYILRVPLGAQRFYSSQCAFPERNSLLVKIETDEGIYGWGEGGQYGPPEPLRACIEYVLAPRIIGKDPLCREVIWDDLYSFTRDFGQKGSYIEAISALDIALWDISGKALGVPIHMLMGGPVRDRIPAYATGCYYRGEDYLDYRSNLANLAEEAEGYAHAGFKMLKIKVGLLSIGQDMERVKAIRKAIGPDISLLVDCNHSYNAYTAVRMGNRLEEYDVLWMEEPVVPEDREGYQIVRNRVNIAVAGGECEYTRYGFRDFLSAGCVDIAQPDVCVCGGISEFKKIQTLAGIHGVFTIPHVWGSGIALAAALQVIAATPSFPHTANPVELQNKPVIEYDRNHNPLRDELLKENIRLENSHVKVPAGPGLGVDIDEVVLEKFV
jgi:D-galactarolactone cycloisomerase